MRLKWSQFFTVATAVTDNEAFKIVNSILEELKVEQLNQIEVTAVARFTLLVLVVTIFVYVCLYYRYVKK